MITGIFGIQTDRLPESQAVSSAATTPAQLPRKDAPAQAGAVGRGATWERAGGRGAQHPSAADGAQGPLIGATFPPQKDASCLEAKPRCFIVASASTVEATW